jgi:carbon dioxide concentrating mechanism protein CcmL
MQLVVQPHDATGGNVGSVEVAVDTVGAGPGDRVLIARGSAARQPPESRSAATDLTIVAIVDSVDLSPRGSAHVEITNRTRTRTRTRSK